NKGWDAQKYNYGSDGYEKFIPEFQYPNNVKASGVTQTVEPTEYSTITTDNVNEYIVMKNQTLTEMKNADGLVFYNKFNIDLNIEDGKAYDIVGIVTIYHDEPQVYIISATEVSGQTLVGDVDEDGNVNITDVTALIDMLLSDNTKPSGDVNGDGQINITDVTDLIDILLKN
ncbi:MAG: dockerin type I repeat-containing protein, partial [Muribaculaceae bacterium]|nr:dockerin type I repeat-containing protein [Muribaculaceae bacterium]